MKFTTWIIMFGVLQLSEGDFTLHIAHVNDLWYQLDEIAEDYGPCQRTTSPTSSSFTTPTSINSTTGPTNGLTTLTSSLVTTSQAITSKPPRTETEDSTSPSPSSFSTLSTLSTIGSDIPTTNYESSSASVVSTSSLPTDTQDLVTTSPATSAESTETTATDDTTSPSPSPFSTVSTVSETASDHTQFYTPTTNSQSSSMETYSWRDPQYATDVCFGGAERHKAKLTDLQSAATAQGAYFLNVNAGNMIGEPNWLSVLGPEPAASIAYELGYHAMGLGPRDFLHGVSVLAEYLKQLKSRNVPVICSNLDISAEPLLKDLIQPYLNVSITVSDKSMRIGIVGFLSKEDGYVADFGRTKIVNGGLTNAVNSLKQQGIKTIIALGNARMDQIESIADKVPDIDIVIGGGSNVFLYNGNSPSSDIVNGSYPTILNKKLYVVEEPHQGKYLGHFNVTFDDSGNIKSSSETNNPVLLNEMVTTTALTTMVATWSAWVQGNVSERLGATVTPFFSSSGNDCWNQECSTGNLLTDAILDSFNLKPWSENMAAVFWPGLAFALHNPSNRTIYFEDIVALLPHNYGLHTGKMPGNLIRQFLEKSVEKTSDGRFLQMAGARVTYDMAKPVNSRVKSVYLRNPVSPTANLEELRDDALYLIGIPSVIANAGVHFLSGVNFSDTGLVEQEILRDYIKKIQIVNVGKEGRIQAAVVIPPCNTDVTGTVFLTIFLTLLFTGVIYLCYLYIWPKYRERRGSMMNLIRMQERPR